MRPAAPDRGRTRRARCGGRGRPGGPGAAVTRSKASSTWSTAASPMAWNPAWSPAAMQRAMCSATSGVSNRRAPAVSVRSAYGADRAAVCEPSEPSQNRSPAAPTAPKLAGRVDAEQFGPVADDLGQRLVRGQPDQRGEIVLAGDHRAGHLVHAGDAEFGGVLQGRPLRVAALSGGQRGERGGPDRVVGVAALPPVRREAAEALHPWDCGHQGGRHERGMDVHPGQVHDAAVRGSVQFGGGRRPLVGPSRLVPPAAQHGPAPRRAGGPFDGAQDLGRGLRAAQVDAGERQAGRRRVDVGVHEGRCHERTGQIHHRCRRSAAPRRPRRRSRLTVAPSTTRAVASRLPGLSTRPLR